MVTVRRVEFQATYLRSVESRSNGLVCPRAQFGCMGSRSVDTDMSAVVGAVAVAVAEVAADVDAAAAIAVVGAVAGPVLHDCRDYHLGQIASTFFDVSYRKTIQNGLKSSALSV